MPVVPVDVPLSPLGEDLVNPPHQIEDSRAQYLQDVLVDLPGLLRERGPLKLHPDFTAITGYEPVDVAICPHPSGSGISVAFVARKVSNNAWYFVVLTPDYSGVSFEIELTTQIVQNLETDIKPSPSGGVIISAFDRYARPAAVVKRLFWKGATKPVYTTGTITASYNNRSISGSGTSWAGSVEPGMFLLTADMDGDRRLVGTVASVEGNASLNLEKFSLQNVSNQAYILTSVRRLPMSAHTKGLITTATNTAVVNGVDTKFKRLDGNYALFRASDLTFIGRVATVQTQTTLTLTANAGVAMSDEPFIAYKVDGINYEPTAAEDTPVGILSAFFANRAVWANYPGPSLPASDEGDSTVWFADPVEMEAVDTAVDGDFIVIPNRANAPGPLINITSTPTALLALKTNVAYTITGTSPFDFQVRHLLDDGCLDTRGVQVYEDAVIWPGRNGIYLFDGLTVTNITKDTWGSYWTESVKGFQTGTDYMCAAVHNDHYILHINPATPPRGITKAGKTTVPTRLTVVLNLRTGALSHWTNVDLRGAKTVPPPFTPRTIGAVFSNDDKIVPVDFDALFSHSPMENDSVVCKGNTAGPDFFWESKLWDFGIREFLKYVKWLKAHYRAKGDDITVEVIEDLDHEGTRLQEDLPAQDEFDSRYLNVFAEQVPFLGVRIYPRSPLTKSIAIARLTAYLKTYRSAR